MISGLLELCLRNRIILCHEVKRFEEWYVAELDKEARCFVDGLISQGVGSSASLPPPWEESDAYGQKHAGTIEVSREVYEELRAKPRPMPSHPYHEGWKSVYDERVARRWWL